MSSQAHELVDTPRTTAVSAQLHTVAKTAWFEQTLEGAILIALLDAILLQRKYNLFTGGFATSTHLDTVVGGAAFFVAAAAVNCWLTGPLAAIGLFAADRLGLRPRAAHFLAFCSCVLPLAAADFLAYQIWAYLGEAFDFNLMFDLTGRRLPEIFAVTAPLLAQPLSLALLLAGGVAGITWWLNRLPSLATRPPLPSQRQVIQGCAIFVLIASTVLSAAAFSDKAAVWGLRKLPAALPLILAFERITDVDGDGFGLLGTPSDSAPLNPAVHPYALEIPGNGIDEDGVAGDLPRDYPGYSEPSRPLVDWPEKPTVVLVVLESFRADIVGTQYNGRAVTPVIDRLAAEGISVDSAWSHNGFTSQSRFHILTGSLADARQGTSLLDDFKDQGYEVAYFSAQDDAFGTAHVRYDRVDTYYDARRDIENRYTLYTTPGSLSVPASVLERKVQDFLGARQRSTPLFLYVNFHDTHYPYMHQGIDNLLGVDALSPAAIAPSRRDQLWATYLNTAANVDRGIGRVLYAVTMKTGRRPAVIVVSDHGESLFEEGFLGHGYALNESQTRVPLVVSGLPMKMRIPFGQADLRDAVSDALAGANGPLWERPAVERQPGGRVFQHLGGFDQPGQISWLIGGDRIIYDFRTDQVSVDGGWVNPGDLSNGREKLFRDLIYAWESMRLTRARELQTTDQR